MARGGRTARFLLARSHPVQISVHDRVRPPEEAVFHPCMGVNDLVRPLRCSHPAEQVVRRFFRGRVCRVGAPAPVDDKALCPRSRLPGQSVQLLNDQRPHPGVKLAAATPAPRAWEQVWRRRRYPLPQMPGFLRQGCSAQRQGHWTMWSRCRGRYSPC